MRRLHPPVRPASWILAATMVCLPLAEAVSAQQARTVEVDGSDVRIRLAGADDVAPGRPTVIFENGLGLSLDTWSEVQDSISAFVPSLAYDRAGIGGSEPRASQSPPTPRLLATELSALLDVLGIEPPWLFVGHSLGGRLIRSYATWFGADEVAGLVYVDPGALLSFESLVETGVLDEDSADELLEEDEAFWEEQPDGMRLEYEMSRDLRSEPIPAAAPRRSPTVALQAGRFEGPPPGLDLPDVDWRALHRVTIRRTADILRRWMGEVADGTYVYTERSGHLIQEDEPELVVWAIRRVLDACESNRN